MKHITNFLLIFFLIFNIQSWAKANDISEFHIEGISLGDSALKFFSENHIKKNSKDYYVNKEFTPVQNDLLDFFETYDAVDFNFKTKDKNYIIAALSGVLFYDDKPIKDCYKKMDEIINDLDNNYPNLDKSDKTTFKHPSPRNKSGKSIVTQISYYFENNDIIQVTCYDYSKEHGSQDHLNVSLQTYEFNDWLYHKAHISTQ
tara:strand:+ start:468 stop:1073 length:606 start_codon:yes stop_codon:yes gene_type:complete